MKKLSVLNESAEKLFDFQSLIDFVCPIYFDNNATTQIDDDVMIEMFKALEKNYANPSGMHFASTEAKKSVELARKNVANFIGCSPEEVVFTSGGTESIVSAINSSMITQYPRNHFITCRTEHNATLNKLKEIEEKVGYNVSYLDVDQDGRFDIKQLEYFLKKEPHRNNLTTIMASNNETGTIHHNLSEAIKLSHEYGALFHIDGVQVAGKIDLSFFLKMSPDFLSISGHKIMAPKGTGALYIKNNVKFIPLIAGGQENQRRGGTENVPGIVGLGVAATKQISNKSNLRTLFIKLIKEKLPYVIVNGGDIWNTVNIGFPYIHREAMVIELSNNGVYASVGSSCSLGISPSHVLQAMRVDEKYIYGSVRFSFSKNTTEYELIKSIKIIEKSYLRLRNLSRGIIP